MEKNTRLMYKNELRKEREKNDNNILGNLIYYLQKYKSWTCKFKEIYLIVVEKFAKVHQ